MTGAGDEAELLLVEPPLDPLVDPLLLDPLDPDAPSLDPLLLDPLLDPFDVDPLVVAGATADAFATRVDVVARLGPVAICSKITANGPRNAATVRTTTAFRIFSVRRPRAAFLPAAIANASSREGRFLSIAYVPMARTIAALAWATVGVS